MQMHMSNLRAGFRSWQLAHTAIVVLCLLLTIPGGARFAAHGQFGEGGGSNSENNNNGNTNEDPNPNDSNNNGSNNVRIINGNTAGISIDARGIVRRSLSRGDANLSQLRLAAAFGSRQPNAFQESPLRKISLNRLENAVDQQLDGGRPLSEEIRYLAGLTRIENVFLFPDSGDVVIAGPAGGWADLPSGDVLNLKSRQPVLRLEDLIVALRAFPRDGKADVVISCSIDPTQQGLARLQAYVHSISRQPPTSKSIVSGLKKSLGQHTITIRGIPSSTRFAHVLISADYRMKLIGIGVEKSPVSIDSYVSLARPSSRGRAMARWFFTPCDDCVWTTEDALTMGLSGDGVKLISEAEFVADNGERHRSVERDEASRRFVEGFTSSYPELAEKLPVYAELRNLIDLSMVAAFLQNADAYARCDWQPATFMDESRISVEVFPEPKSVGTAANAVWKGKRLLTPVGGGVNIAPSRAFGNERRLQVDRSLRLRRGAVPVVELGAEGWWWD
jgi:hypothetical protein